MHVSHGSPPSASRPPSWRRRLATVVVTTLVATAASLLSAAPAGAQVTSGPGSQLNAGEVTGQFTATGLGGVTFSEHRAANTFTAETSVITMGADRTLLTMNSLNLAAEDTLRLVVGARSDTVLIRVDSGAAVIGGTLSVTVGSTAGAVGGNVWIVAAGGVVFGPQANVDAGGLLAATGAIADVNFFHGDAFTFSDTPGGPTTDVLLQSGSRVSGHGGLVAFAAPSVHQTAGSVVRDLSAGLDTDVLFGAANEFTIAVAPDTDGDRDLTSYSVTPGQASGAPIPIEVAGTVTAGNVYLVSDSSSATAIGPVVVGTVTAPGDVIDGDGVLALVSGGGIIAGAPTGSPLVPARATQRGGASQQPIVVGVPLAAGNQTIVAASGDLTLTAPAVLSGQQVTVSTGDDLAYPAGAISPSSSWVIYAPTPTDVPNPGLNSGQTAIWGSTIGSRPPAGVTGNRYVFAERRSLMFSATEVTKDFGEVPDLPYTHNGTAAFHPGVAGLFAADTLESVVVGEPALTSAGTAAGAKVPLVGFHPIDITTGGLTSPAGYDFHVVDNKLWVVDHTPPVVTVEARGDLVNGWFTTDAAVDWTVDEPESDTAETGCEDFTITQDQGPVNYSCVVRTFADARQTDLQGVQRDATDPVLTIVPAFGSTGYTAGAWINWSSVTLEVTCTDDLSGVQEVPPGRTVTETGLVEETCTDTAGNVATASFQVNLDSSVPTVDNEVLQSRGLPYEPGDWTNDDVVVTWDCVDIAGSPLVEESGRATVTDSGTHQSMCEDIAGNRGFGDEFEITIDRSPPSVTDVAATSDGLPYAAGGWAKDDVTVTWTCVDTGGSGAVEASRTETVTATVGVVPTCADEAGNTVSGDAFQVNIDTTAPAITGVAATLPGGAPYIAGDWTAEDVTVTWTCVDDGGSGVLEPNGSVSRSDSGVITPICADRAGHVVRGSGFQVNIDAVPPVLAGVPADRSVPATGQSAVVSWTAPTATDDQDTSVDVVCDPASGGSFAVGATTVTCSATDHAGNRAQASFTVTVTRAPTVAISFGAPIDAPPVINRAKPGRIVPVAVTLTLDGRAITQTTPQPLSIGLPTKVSCSTGQAFDAVETYSSRRSSGNLFRWNATSNRWVFDLDAEAFGMRTDSCYRVPVVYGGTVYFGIAFGGSQAGFFHLQPKK